MIPIEIKDLEHPLETERYSVLSEFIFPKLHLFDFS